MYEWRDFAFKVPLSVKINSELPENEVATSVKQVFDLFKQFEAHLSREVEGSEVYKLNHQRGRALVVSESLFELLNYSMALAHKSHGAFDPCVADFLDAYGYRNNREINTSAVRVLKNRRAGFRHISLDPETRTVQLLPSQRIELDALLKGYVIDLAAQILLAQFQNFCIDLGGDVLAIGQAENKENWHVPVLNPFDEIGGMVWLSLRNMGLATTTTSGEGKVMVINPASGEPAGEVVSVTVIAPSAFRADSLATTAFVLGIHRGIAFLEHENGVEGMLVTPDKTVLCTTGMRRFFVEEPEETLK